MFFQSYVFVELLIIYRDFARNRKDNEKQNVVSYIIKFYGNLSIIKGVERRCF